MPVIIHARCFARVNHFDFLYGRLRRSPTVAYTQVMGSSRNESSNLQTVDQEVLEPPEELWSMIQARYEAAQAVRAATMTETSLQLEEESGFTFILKIAANLAKKPKPKQADNQPSAGVTGAKKNPFLPPEPELFVCYLSSTHSLVLNKYNIVPHHSLIITRNYEPQESSLTAADFEATMAVVRAMPRPYGGLAYFNCGPQSGASQPHKHIQVIPLPLITGPMAELGATHCSIPFQRAIEETLAGKSAWSVTSVHSLSFINFVARINVQKSSQLAETHAAMLRRAKEEVGQSGMSELSFNTLFTEDFMMLIPRSKESYSSVFCNAMAFAGSFFVRNIDELHAIREIGPLRILSEVGFLKKRNY